MNLNTTFTLTIEIPQDLLMELQQAYKTIDGDWGSYEDFEEWLLNTIDFRLLKHIRQNMELMLDLRKHFTDLQQT